MSTGPHESAFAYPGVKIHDDNFIYGENGLTKREYFAAVALRGLLSQPNVKFDSPTTPKQIREAYAEAATLSADALIDALNRVKE